jgi:hypothetical protein
MRINRTARSSLYKKHLGYDIFDWIFVFFILVGFGIVAYGIRTFRGFALARYFLLTSAAGVIFHRQSEEHNHHHLHAVAGTRCRGGGSCIPRYRVDCRETDEKTARLNRRIGLLRRVYPVTRFFPGVQYAVCVDDVVFIHFKNVREYGFDLIVEKVVTGLHHLIEEVFIVII